MPFAQYRIVESLQFAQAGTQLYEVFVIQEMNGLQCKYTVVIYSVDFIASDELLLLRPPNFKDTRKMCFC